MLGFAGLDVALAYWLCILSAAFCVAYGIRMGSRKTRPDKSRMVRRIVVEK